MTTILEVTEKDNCCAIKYAKEALEHVRVAEHKITEILEKLEISEN